MGFALEMGDRLVINGEEVTFKGWIDQTQTAITVQAIADATDKKIHARDIKSLGRSVLPESSNKSDNHQGSAAEMSDENHADPSSPDAIYEDAGTDQESPNIPEPPDDEPVLPTYNAWEVWTYLERQRLKTLKLINTFETEWEANRFVREAERNTPPNLRIHYEICPIWLNSDAVTSDANHDDLEHFPDENSGDRIDVEDADPKYADAIDVEIIA